MKHCIAILILLGVISIFTVSARAEQEPQTLTFELLEKTVYSEKPPPIFPAELRKLEGKRVRLSGFMIPYDDPEKLFKLMLVKTPGGCFFCSPPSPTSVVFVRRPATDSPLSYTTEIIVFEGILHLWHSELKDDDETKGFFFTLDDAKAIVDKSTKSQPWKRNKITEPL